MNVMAGALFGRCPYCDGQMFHSVGKSRINGSNPMRPSRDHVLPREWGGLTEPDNLRNVHALCNEMRAIAGHCVGALACARAVTPSIWVALHVLNRWNLPQPANPLRTKRDSHFVRYHMRLARAARLKEMGDENASKG